MHLSGSIDSEVYLISKQEQKYHSMEGLCQIMKYIKSYALVADPRHNNGDLLVTNWYH